jgi:hypothetical protein
MLLWVVNPRHTLRRALSGISVPLYPQLSTLNFSPRNSFGFCPFRTLASHLKASVSSNPFEIKRFRTLCKIPGIEYPPSFNFVSHSHAQTALHERTNCALSCLACPERRRRETERGVRNNSFLPRAEGRGACHTLAPREFEGCAFHRGRGGRRS